MTISAYNIPDIILALYFLVSVIRGWHIGLALRVTHLLTLLVSGALTYVLVSAVSARIPYIAGAGLSVVIFLTAFMLLWKVAKLVKIVDFIPVVGTLDKIGGAAAGFFVAFLVCCYLFHFLYLVIPQTTWNAWGLTQKAVNQTYLLQSFLK